MPVQRLVHMGFYKKSFDASELSTAILSVLSRFKITHVVSFIRDRASVNSAAVRTLKNHFQQARTSVVFLIRSTTVVIRWQSMSSDSSGLTSCR